jgi:hypothetical protein
MMCPGMAYTILFFYLSDGSSGTVNVDFVVDRLLYNVQPNNIVDECSFALDGTSSYALSEGINTSYTAVLSLNASRPIDYARDGVEIRTSCQPCAWLYSVIVLAVCVTIIILCGILLAACI